MSRKSSQIKKYLSPLPFYKKKILCRAPFTSLILFLNGNILICCVNKEFVIGRYPEDNLHSAWFGEKIKDLRKSILSFDLSKGCQECLSQIELGNFSSVKAGFYNYLPINKNGYPSQLEFVLDNTCNLECIMCNHRTSSAIYKTCQIKDNSKNPYLKSSILEDIVEFTPYLKHVNFVGGEPFLSALYYKMWEIMLAINKNIRFNISTNGTILNEKIKTILNKGSFDIGVSIDSVRKETYESIRKNAHFEEVIKNVTFFKRYCEQKETNFSIWACPMVPNAYEIPELLEYFNKENVPVYFNTVTMPHILSIRNLSSGKISDIISYYSENKPNSNNENTYRFNDLINQLRSWHAFAMEREIQEEKLSVIGIDGLLQLYISNANQYFEKTTVNESQKILLQDKIQSLIINKNNGVNSEFLRFLINLPIHESTLFLINNSNEDIEHYIGKSF